MERLVLRRVQARVHANARHKGHKVCILYTAQFLCIV